jgi:hypothetical protein
MAWPLTARRPRRLLGPAWPRPPIPLHWRRDRSELDLRLGSGAYPMRPSLYATSYDPAWLTGGLGRAPTRMGSTAGATASRQSTRSPQIAVSQRSVENWAKPEIGKLEPLLLGLGH